MALSRRFRKRTVQFEVIPVIDVLFTLLIFFVIYSASVAGFSNKGIHLKLPSASTVSQQTSGLFVTIDADNKIYLDGVEVQEQEVKIKTQERLQTQPDLAVSLRADQKTPYDTVIQVLDDLRFAGAQHVSLEAVQKKASYAK